MWEQSCPRFISPSGFHLCEWNLLTSESSYTHQSYYSSHRWAIMARCCDRKYYPQSRPIIGSFSHLCDSRSIHVLSRIKQKGKSKPYFEWIEETSKRSKFDHLIVLRNVMLAVCSSGSLPYSVILVRSLALNIAFHIMQ